MYKPSIPQLNFVDETRYINERSNLLEPSELEVGQDYTLRLFRKKRPWSKFAVDHLVRIYDKDENSKRLLWPTIAPCVELEVIPLDMDCQIADKSKSIQIDDIGAVFNQRAYDWRPANGGYLLIVQDEYTKLLDKIMEEAQSQNNQSSQD